MIDSLSYSDLKSRVLHSKVFFKSLSSGEVVCPLADDVVDSDVCSNCKFCVDCPARL